MAKTIALAGKGGTGKTTLSGFLIDYLCKAGCGPILAVDADANSNLNEVLGVEAPLSLGELREEIISSEKLDTGVIPASMTKQDYLNIKFGDALAEREDFDLLVMGRTQGQGCYCYVNGLLQTQISKYSGNYKYVVVDNEAGLEHLSRGVLPSVDMVLLVSDCSRRGVATVARIAQLVGELNLNPKTIKLIINRAPGGKLDSAIEAEVQAHGLELAGIVPQDEMVYQYDCEGKPTATLSSESKARSAFNKILKKII